MHERPLRDASDAVITARVTACVARAAVWRGAARGATAERRGPPDVEPKQVHLPTRLSEAV